MTKHLDEIDLAVFGSLWPEALQSWLSPKVLPKAMPEAEGFVAVEDRGWED